MDRIRVILDYPIGTARQRKHALFTGHWMRPEHKEAKRKSNGDRSNCADLVENESTEGNGNKQWAVGVKILALLFSSLFCPCHIVHCLPMLCSWCLDRDKQVKPTHGFLEDLTQLWKQDLHPPIGEKAGLWAQSRNRFCCWLSRILQQNFQQCCQVRLLWDIACCLKKERKWQWLYVKPGRDIATLLFIYSTL